MRTTPGNLPDLDDREGRVAVGVVRGVVAAMMTEGGFQHIVVVDPHETRGVISMRDIVRRWTDR